MGRGSRAMVESVNAHTNTQQPRNPIFCALTTANKLEGTGGMKTELERFFESQGRGWSPATVERYRWYLENLRSWLEEESLPLDPAQITEEHICRWLDSHLTWASVTRYCGIVACKNFFRWKLGRENSPAEGIRYPKRPVKPQRTLDEPRIMQILSNLDTSRPKGVRDTAIILLLLDTGLRASEVCNLQRSHVDLENRTFIALIKGERWSEGVFGTYCAAALAHWLDIRPDLAQTEEGALFVSIGGIRPGTAMTRHGLNTIFRKIGKKVGFHFSPHDFRRTFATLAIKAGAPSRLVQVAGRWNDLSMVERYSQSLKPADMDPYSPVNKLMGLSFEDGE